MPARDGHVEAGLLADQGTSSRIRASVLSSGPRTASTMQNSGRPRAAVSRGRAEDVCRCRETGWPSPVVSKRDDCEQKWQSSGQPPVLAERIPSTSTAGPHQARRTWWASAARATTAPSPRAAKAGELLAAELATLVEQGRLGGGQQRPIVGGEGRLDLRGRSSWVGRLAGRKARCYAWGNAGLVGHGAHGSGRASPPRSRADRRRHDEEAVMAWDFSTEPEFEEKLEWMRGFVREEVFPLETLDLTEDQLTAAIGPLQEEVKRQGLWAAHLPPELGGMGFGQVRLGLMHEILGQTPYGAGRLRQQRPGLGERRAAGRGHRPVRPRGPARAVAAAPLGGPAAQRLLDDRARARRARTPPSSPPRAVRDGDEYVINGRKWFTTNGSVADFLIVMAVTNPDVHPYQGSSMILVPVDTPGVEIVRDVATMEDPTAPYGRFGNHAEIDYHDVRVPAANLIGTRGRRVRAGPGPAGAGPHPPLHALARPVPPGLRHALRAGGVALRLRLAAGREADHPELGGGLAGPDVGGPPDDPARRLEDGPRGRGGRPRTRSP